MKIFVYGFAHSGTTILRKLIGDHSQIYDYADEVSDPPEMDDVVFKCPILPDSRHDRCRRIMIIKNPYDIFGSFFLRFGDEYLSVPGHTIEDYEEHVKYFLYTDDFKIKYEHLNEHTLPVIFDNLGLKYEGIKKRDAFIGEGWQTPKKCPRDQTEGLNHGYYRQWQINQPFKNMTGRSQKYLPKETRDILRNNKIIKMLYD
jgi:hypothetical protein